jgi:hypothetical protein
MGVKSAMARGLSSGLEPAMVLLTTQSFSGVASQAFTNVFSATYDNYVVMFNDVVGSTSSGLTLQLGATNTGYYQFGVFGRFGAATVTGDNKSNGSNFTVIGELSTSGVSGNISIFKPFLAKITTFENRSTEISSTNGYYYNAGGYVNNTTSYTGFTINVNTGNMTGSVSVYGFNK